MGAAKRIVILGCAGTGKTLLAKRIGAAASMPVVCLDEIWRRLPAPPDAVTFRAALREAHAGDSWVSEGNFSEVSFDIRLPRSELIVWLERSRMLCMWRSCVRVFRTGEKHQLRDLGRVLAYIRGFERRNRAIIEAERMKHGGSVPVLHLHSAADTAKLLNVLSG